ncbi:ParB N-terminal domain-containing protein [Pedomonas sp. V897]|uniref:ParB N-terminal domain-containing protein n=1 Tax=Pedomonas sp. V897 TaxID=3446482 RepID=UPI003EE2AA39
MATKWIYAIHGCDAEHLEEVKAQMKALGAPVIRVVDCGDYYQALEGSHRLAAAAELGLEPELAIYGQDDEIDLREFDWFDGDTTDWAGPIQPAGAVAGELYDPQRNVPYRFERAA